MCWGVLAVKENALSQNPRLCEILLAVFRHLMDVTFHGSAIYCRHRGRTSEYTTLRVYGPRFPSISEYGRKNFTQSRLGARETAT